MYIGLVKLMQSQVSILTKFMPTISNLLVLGKGQFQGCAKITLVFPTMTTNILIKAFFSVPFGFYILFDVYVSLKEGPQLANRNESLIFINGIKNF